MKIAYFINDYPKVSHSFIRREILALERRGFEVLRIALRGWANPSPDAEDARERERTRYVLRGGTWRLLIALLAALLRTPRRFAAGLSLAARMSRHSDRPLPYHIIYLAEACRIIPWLREFGAQRVHAHFGTNSTEVVMLAKVMGGPPFSFTVHGPDEFMRPMGLDQKIHRAEFAVAISNFGRSQLYLRSAYADWPKIKVVHCGVDRSFFDTTAAPSSAPRLVCVGRLCEAKGQMLLIDAAAELRAKGVPFELVLAGDGPMRAELEAQIAKHGLQRQIRITGWISGSEVRNELLQARAMVLPSFAEGLPVVIMEALALRRPVLSTYIAGIPELVLPEVNGWLFAAGAVDELVSAMQDCLTAAPERLQMMGDAGYLRVLARHSVDIEAGKMAELLSAPARSA